MTQALPITSDDLFTDVDHHFRITAGPGAGKTHWLVKHIAQVIRLSDRLTPCSRVAVISYTNVAIREIVGRLGPSGSKVDASTIHSFLFRNIVRPYVHLVKDASGNCLVTHHLVDTHDVHYPAYNKVDAWVRASGVGQLMSRARAAAFQRLLEQLRSLTVRISGSGEAVLSPCKTDGRDRSLQSLLTPERLLAYKQQYWSEGTVDHEDVLYFAHRILHENPRLCRFLSDRFPYLFIDEFQDTLPVQAELVRLLAAAGTKIGVIGDPEQAIFDFVDASPIHFRTFALEGHRNYTMAKNRRSTKSIVEFLNRVRTDGLQQEYHREDVGTSPIAFAGNLTETIAHARRIVPAEKVMLVLGRKHLTVAQARLGVAGYTTDPWDSLREADDERARLLMHAAVALDLAHRKLFDSAITRLVQGISSRRGFRKPIAVDAPVDMTLRRSVALMMLKHLLGTHQTLLQQTALDFYNSLYEFLPTCADGMSLTAVRSGKFRDAAAAVRYHDLIHVLHTPDETRSVRTIHQAKGAQAPAVFVILDDNQLDHILNPVANEEEQRITYVALSRAEDHIFLFCPNDARLAELAAFGMVTQTIGEVTSTVQPRRRRSRRTAEN